MLVSLLSKLSEVVLDRVLIRTKTQMSQVFKARMFYQVLHGKIETFLDVIPSHELINIMKKAGKAVIKITMILAKLLSHVVKLGFTVYAIRHSISWPILTFWAAYGVMYFYSVQIQLRFTLESSKLINKHRTKNPNNLGLVMFNLAEIRCMRL